MKSVNHRYAEVVFRLPREWNHLEDKLRKLVVSRIGRGRVDVAVAVDRTGETPRQAAVDWEIAAAYAEAANRLKERFGLAESGLTAWELLKAPGVFSVREDELPEGADDELLACAASALERLAAMREAEGQFLAADARAKLAAIEERVARIQGLSAGVTGDYRERLRERIAQLTGGSVPVDEARLAAEVAYFAERSAIDEELTRLASHAKQFAALLGADEPVGRKLDFLLQEMNREANTIGSKANHADVSALVVEVKAELEKLREQTQNIE